MFLFLVVFMTFSLLGAPQTKPIHLSFIILKWQQKPLQITSTQRLYQRHVRYVIGYISASSSCVQYKALAAEGMKLI